MGKSRLLALCLLLVPGIGSAAGGKRAHPKAKRIPALERRVSVNVSEVTVPMYLEELSRQAHVKFVIDPGLENSKFSASLKGMKLKLALELLKGVDVVYRPIKGHADSFRVSRRPPRKAEGAEILGVDCRFPAKNVSLEMREGTVKKYLEAISAQSGLSFVASPEVASRKTGVIVKNEPLEAEMKAFLSANSLNCRMQGEAYLISPAP